MSPMVLRDVLYVPGLKKNLVSVSMIEDRGLGVSFLDGHVYMFPKTARPSASVAGNCIGSCFSLSMPWHIAAIVSFVFFGIGGWLTCIIQLGGLLRNMVTGLLEFNIG